MKTPSPPSHLGTDAAEFWRRVQHDYTIDDAAGLALLTSAAECLDAAERARAVVATEGQVYLDRFDAPRLRPEVGIERNSILAFARVVKVLGLDCDATPQPTGRR